MNVAGAALGFGAGNSPRSMARSMPARTRRATGRVSARLCVSFRYLALAGRRENVKDSGLFQAFEKLRPASGGKPAAREPGLGTGRGGDVTGIAQLLKINGKRRSGPPRGDRPARPKYWDRAATAALRSGSRLRSRAESPRSDCRERIRPGRS